jgi:hypothetical protein
MTRGNALRSDAVGIVEQLAELEPVVADDAGIRRAGRAIFADEIVDDLAELVGEVQGVKRNVEQFSHAAGIGGVGGAAAALLVVGPRREDCERRGARPLERAGPGAGSRTDLLNRFPVAHEHTDDLVARGAQ